jgi:small-conductance mechanosensitive channel
MELLGRVKDILFYPLVHLAGGPVTTVTLLVGVLIILGSRIVAATTSSFILRTMQQRGAEDGVRFAVAKIARYVIQLIGLLVAVTSTGFKLDAVFAASAVLLVGIGFGLQNIAQNFICGIILLIERPVAQGDFVQIGKAFGSVVDVGLRATHVVTRDEVTIIVPNSELITGQVINHSVPTTRRRISVQVGVAYGTEPALVRDTLIAVAGREPQVMPEPPPEVRFENFGDSSLDFSLLVWIAAPRADLRISSDLRFAIDAAFRAAKIEIPFPQRVVHMREQKSG